jgi:hypothetical protein
LSKWVLKLIFRKTQELQAHSLGTHLREVEFQIIISVVNGCNDYINEVNAEDT